MAQGIRFSRIWTAAEK